MSHAKTGTHSHGGSDAIADVVLRPASVESRFLFVDVAARRANQLRRGALLRLTAGDGRHIPHKLERAAMEEVKQQLVLCHIPDISGLP